MVWARSVFVVFEESIVSVQQCDSDRACCRPEGRKEKADRLSSMGGSCISKTVERAANIMWGGIVRYSGNILARSRCSFTTFA